MRHFHATKKGPSRIGQRSEKEMDEIVYEIKRGKRPWFDFRPGAKVLKKVSEGKFGISTLR